MARSVLLAPWPLLIGLTLVPSVALAQTSYAGTWTAGPTRMQVQLSSWGGDCGPRPANATVPGGGQVRVTEAGDQLVIRGRTEQRTDRCWSENHAVHVVSSTRQPGEWRVVCRTAPSDSKAETGTYTLNAENEDRLVFRDVSRYDWQLNESRCTGTITSTQVFTRVRAATTTTPTEPTRPEAPRCTPGAPAELRLRPAEARIEPGEQARFTARVVDRAGCAVASQRVQWELRRPASVAGELEGGVFTAAQTAAEAEGEFTVIARAGSLRAQATVNVHTADLSDLIARRSSFGIVQSSDDVGDLELESAAGVSARSETPTSEDGWVLPAVVGAGALLVVALVLVIVLARRKRSVSMSPPLAGAMPKEVSNDAEPEGAASTPTPGPLMPRVCPVCSAEFEDGTTTFCPHDGAELLRHDESPTGQPLICPTCRRGFVAGTKTCPTDGDELVAYGLFVARHRAKEHGEEKAKICPVCGDRYGRQVTFCGKDGSELVLVN